MRFNTNKSRCHRYPTRSSSQNGRSSQVTKSPVLNGTCKSSASYDEELDKRLKSKYGIKELRIVLHDYLYDKSLPLHMRCFLTFKDAPIPVASTKDNNCLRSLPDLSADDLDFVSSGYNAAAVYDWINTLHDTKENCNTLEEKKSNKSAEIVQDIKYRTEDIKEKGKVPMTKPKNEQKNSTETCKQAENIKIMLRRSASNNGHFIIENNSSVCSDEESLPKLKKTSNLNNVVKDDGLYTPKLCRRKWNPCEINKKINIGSNLNINNNCDIIQNKNEVESWKNVEHKSKDNFKHSPSSDERSSIISRRRVIFSDPTKIQRKRRRIDSSSSESSDEKSLFVNKKRLVSSEPAKIQRKTSEHPKPNRRSSSQPTVNYNVSEKITKCNSKRMSDVSGLTSISILQSEHVSSVHKVDVVDVIHKPNDVAVVSPTLSKENMKRIDAFISSENSSGSNPCTNKNVIASPQTMVIGETCINKENVPNRQVTNFGFPENGQIFEKNSEKQANEKSNGIENKKFNVVSKIDNHMSSNSVMPETLKSNSNVDHSSRKSVDPHVDTFSNDNAVLNTEVFENKQSSQNKRKLPRITEDSILPKGTLDFLLRNREAEKNLDEVNPMTDESENWRKLNNVTERYFASFQDVENSVQNLPSLNETNMKQTENNITSHIRDDLSSVTLALTADNLTKFNDVTNVEKAAPNSSPIFHSPNEIKQSESVTCAAEIVRPGKSSNEKQSKRRWLGNNENSLCNHTETKKLKLNRSTSRNNSMACFPSPLNSASQRTERTEFESNKNFDNKSARSSGTSEKFREPDLVLIESADTIQMCTPGKSLSETSIETQELTQIIDSWENEQLDLGKDLPANIAVEPVLENCDFPVISLLETSEKEVTETNEEVAETNEKLIVADGELAETNVPEETATEGVEKSTTNTPKKTKRNKKLEEDDNDDVINLYVDDEDLISLCNTEIDNVNLNPPTNDKLKAVGSTFGVDATPKETNDRKVLSESEHGSSDSSPFNINVFINQTVKDFNKVYETLESRSNEKKLLRSRNLTFSRNINRRMPTDIKKDCTNGFDQESAVPANIKKAQTPTSVNYDLQKVNYQEIDRKNEIPFYGIHKIFAGYCFTLLKHGGCYKEDSCHFRHDIRSLVQEICHRKREHYSTILDYLIERQYAYIAKVSYMDVLQFSDSDRILEFYKKLVESRFLNYMTVFSTLNTLLRKKISINDTLIALISPLYPKNTAMSPVIIDVAEKHIPTGEYWSTLREIFLKIRPSASQIVKILTECVTAEKDIQHVEDVNKNVVTMLSKAERASINDGILSSFYNYVRSKRQQFNDSQNAIATIASPDQTEKAGDVSCEAMKVTSLNENSQRLDSEPLTNCTKAAKSAGVSDDGKSFVLHPIDNLPEPSSAHRNRFWKFNLDVQCIREGLKHFDYEYVREILDKYADADQRTLISRSFYNILRTEIKRSQSHLNNIIELSVQAGSLAALDAVIQAGKYVLKAFIHEALWGFAYILQKLLRPYNSRPDAEVVLILAEIFIANQHCLKAFTLLKQYNIICTNRTKWRVPSNDNDSDLRIIVISLLLEMFCKESVEHAFHLFEFLLREQTYNYTPIDLTRCVDKLMSQLLSANCLDKVKAMATFAIENNFTFNTTTFRALITYLYHHDMSLAKQMYRYGIGLGVYNAITVSFPVIIRINIYWTEEEVHFLLSYLFEKLVEDIGPGIDRLRPNVLRIYVFFETIPSDYRHGETVNSEEVKRLEKNCIKTVRKLLHTRFEPFITITMKNRINRMLKLQSKSVVNYLKSIS